MSIERLQEKIRKYKNPVVIDVSMRLEHIPPQITECSVDYTASYLRYSKELLDGLKDTVPAVRFSFPAFSLLGSDGLAALEDLLSYAKVLGYYVILDCAELLNPQNLAMSADILFGEDSKFYFDGLIVTAYSGSDALRPYIAKLEGNDKDLFIVSRTANKSASEFQDLLTGSRHTHLALCEMVNRLASPYIGRSGYSRIAVMAAASAPESIRSLRNKFKNLFLLLDGCDYPNSNAKNCSYAFDALGRGAIMCAGTYVTASWQEDNDPDDYLGAAVRAAERLKKNILRYITIL